MENVRSTTDMGKEMHGDSWNGSGNTELTREFCL